MTAARRGLADTARATAADDSLRSERNRFAATAFAAMDAIFEVLADGVVRRHTGSPLAAGGIVPEHLDAMIEAADAATLVTAFDSLIPGHRLTPRLVKCRSGQPGIVYAIKLQQGRVFAGLRHLPAEYASGVTSTERFCDAAKERESDFLAVACLLDMAAVQERMPDATVHLLQQLTGFCDDIGLIFCRLSDDEFAFAGRGNVDIAPLETFLTEAVRDLDPARRGVTVVTAGRRGVPAGGSEFRSALESFQTTGAFEGAEGPVHLRQAARARVSPLWAVEQRIADGEFTLQYQPVLGLDDGSLHFFETNIRFAPDVSPYHQILLAEQHGAIADLDLAVLSRVIEQLARSPVGRRRSVSVNISGGSLRSDRFLSALVGRLAEHPELAPYVLLELTESVQINGLGSVASRLQTLRNLGVRVCLDDFGAGMSSLPYLRALPIDIVKVDKGFLHRAGETGLDAALLRAVVGLCRDLRVTSVAEGIETRAHEVTARALGFDLGQGYRFGMPQSDWPADTLGGPIQAGGAQPPDDPDDPDAGPHA